MNNDNLMRFLISVLFSVLTFVFLYFAFIICHELLSTFFKWVKVNEISFEKVLEMCALGVVGFILFFLLTAFYYNKLK